MQIIEMNGLSETLLSKIVAIERPGLAAEFARRRADAERAADESGARLKITEARRIGRNDPCPCGSGVKFKRCCGQNLPLDDKRVKD